uniref:ATPase putative n=1 Tax=Albugo laibachii Nc14 TaxID=890382 RepID=F0WXP2_9STRA|nr:ATPase putative [Albugo laibachii Nc14]|eukprot:CCA26236.1 ATPase putative [Albugo laibachii Nc14]
MGKQNSSNRDATVESSSIDQNNQSRDLKALGSDLVGIIIDAVMLYGVWVTSKYIYKSIKPRIDELRQNGGTRTKLQQRLLRSGRATFQTTFHEDVIAGDIVDPFDIPVTFDDIGGLESQKRDIYDLVILPLKCPRFFNTRGKLLSVPKGILLYGKPGTGKTMLAKAIAKESGAFFIDLKISTLMSKWFGESQKLVRAAFSLASKLAPCIIFIDEVDSFMGKRGGASDPTYSTMKTEFLALWDGFAEISNAGQGFGVIVLGATNRPFDVDPAFLRRMPRTFEIGLPDQNQREKILTLHLQNEDVDSDFDFRRLSLDTVSYSGSDLKELCRAALMIPLRECLEKAGNSIPKEDDSEECRMQLRPLSLVDFKEARNMVQPTGVSAYAYESGISKEDTTPSVNMDAFAAIMATGLQQMMKNMQRPNFE